MVDVRSAVSNRVRTARGVALDKVRFGSRTVHMAPDSGLGFGNYLYLLFDAHRRQDTDLRVLLHPQMERWLAPLPQLRSRCCVVPSGLRISDRREHWRFRLADSFGTDFSRDQLEDFINQYLLPLASPSPKAEVVLNVRRGDYYSNPYVRGTHSMDVVAYVQKALQVAGDEERIPSITVVSDDVVWCRSRLDAGIKRFVPDVTYAPTNETPQDNFRRVASARRLIGTNSTFGYWGGYISNVLYGRASQVVMPWFHARLGDDYGARQLNPEWTIIQNIPGGWDS